MHEDLDAGHERANLGEVALADHLRVVGEAGLVVVLLDRRHDLVQAQRHVGGELQPRTQVVKIYAVSDLKIVNSISTSITVKLLIFVCLLV